MKTALIRSFIETRREPLRASVETAARLDVLCDEAPEFCLKALSDVRTHVSQKAQLLAGLIRSSTDRTKIVCRLHTLSDDELLHVIDGLRRRRLNGRRVRELGLATLVGHPRFADLAANHRLRLVRIFRHLLGERTWSSIRRSLELASPDGEQYLQAKVMRFATSTESARETLCFLAGLGFDEPSLTRDRWRVLPWRKKSESKPFEFTSTTLRQSAAARRNLEAGRGMPRTTLSGIRGTFHPSISARVLRELAAPVIRRESTDGALTAAIKESLVSSQVTSLDAIVEGVADENSPIVDVRTAVVLDLSGSSASSGERLYHPAALGLALVGLLQRHVSDLNVFQVGGSEILNGHGIPRPQGVTDLATAVMEAARTEPEAILIVTDGYENCRQGDVAQVVAGMRRLGLMTAVEQVTPVIAAAEDLSRRRLSAAMPVVPVENETGVGELAARLLVVEQSHQLEADELRTVERLLFGFNADVS